MFENGCLCVMRLNAFREGIDDDCGNVGGYLVLFAEGLDSIELLTVGEVWQSRQLPKPDDGEAAVAERLDDLLDEPGPCRAAHPAIGGEVDTGEVVVGGAFLNGVYDVPLV